MASNGKSWKSMIFMSRFYLEFIGEGIEIAFGILMPDLTKRLGSSSATTGFLVSLHVSLWFLAAPLAQLLLDHCSRPRTLTTVCGLLTGLFMMGIAFTENVALFGLLLVLSAICASVLHRQATILLHEYFPDNFAFISTATFFGAIIGGLVIPQLVSLSLMAYDVGGSLLILGGINLNMLAAGYALKPCKLSDKELLASGESEETSPLISKPEEIFEGATACRTDKHKNISHEGCRDELYRNIKRNRIDDRLLTDDLESTTTNVEMEPHVAGVIGEDKPCFISGNCDNVRDSPRNQVNYVSRDRVESDDENPDRDNGLGKDTMNEKVTEGRSPSIFNRLKEIARVDFMMRNPLVSCTLVPSKLIAYVLIGGSDFFEVTYGISQGLEPRNAHFIPIASVSGCAASQIILTIVLRYKPTYCDVIFLMSCCLSTLGFFLITLNSSFWYILVMSFVIGFGINGAMVTDEGVMDFVVEEEDFDDGSALADFAGGLGFLLSGFVAGYILDVTGSMKIVFWSLGGMNLAACFLMLVLVLKVACSAPERQ